MSEFVLDIERIRVEARRKIEDGAVTPDYRGEPSEIIELFSGALATEWLCVLRYTQHALAAKGIHAESVAEHFREHARQEQEHANALAERIRQLGGTPHLDPSQMAEAAHTEYKECDNLIDMIKENLIAERIAIEVYSETIRYIGDKDSTSRRVLEEILAVEEEHADDMADLLAANDASDKLN